MTTKLSEQFEQEFVDTYLKNSMHADLDSLGAELYMRIYLEPSDISMEDLARKTGYSLSAVSGKLKVLESMGAIQKINKPGTKKLFFHTDKNMGETAIKKIKLYLQSEIKPLKNSLPNLLEKYASEIKKSKNEKFKKQYLIVKDYLIQLDYTEQSMLATITHIESLIGEHCKNNKM